MLSKSNLTYAADIFFFFSPSFFLVGKCNQIVAASSCLCLRWSQMLLIPRHQLMLGVPISLLTQICTLVSIRLNTSNYVLGHFQVTQILKAHSLFDFIDDTLPYGDKKIEENGQIPNPKYSLWHIQDYALTTLINATLSQTTLSLMVGCTSAYQVWESLEKHYSSFTRTCIIEIKYEL